MFSSSKAFGVRTIVFGLVFALTLLTGRAIQAHDLGYRYEVGSNVWLSNINTNYSNAIGQTIADYDINTDLTVTSFQTCQTYGICFRQDDRGTGFPLARAIARRSLSGTTTYCANLSNGALTGQCNTTTSKANGGTIYLNINASVRDFLDGNAVFVMKHETGHIFGMAHGDCNEVSVMVPGGCTLYYNALQAHDKNTINSWY